MPYKARLKTGASRKHKKAQYKVQNWSEYNQSLKKRGATSLYFPKGSLKEILYNENTYVEGVSWQRARISASLHSTHLHFLPPV